MANPNKMLESSLQRTPVTSCYRNRHKLQQCKPDGPSLTQAFFSFSVIYFLFTYRSGRYLRHNKWSTGWTKGNRTRNVHILATFKFFFSANLNFVPRVFLEERKEKPWERGCANTSNSEDRSALFMSRSWSFMVVSFFTQPHKRTE